MNRYINRNKSRDDTIEAAYFSGLREALRSYQSTNGENNISYTIEKVTAEDGSTHYSLIEIKDNQRTPIGDQITLNANEIFVDGQPLSEYLEKIRQNTLQTSVDASNEAIIFSQN